MDQYNNMNDFNNVRDVNNLQPINNVEAANNIDSSVEHQWQPTPSFFPPNMDIQKKEKKAKPSREERGYTEPRGPKKKDDWMKFFAPENSKWLKGEKPDFEEEGWARRKPKKK